MVLKRLTKAKTIDRVKQFSSCFSTTSLLSTAYLHGFAIRTSFIYSCTSKLTFTIYMVKKHVFLCTTPIILHNSLWTIKAFRFRFGFIGNWRRIHGFLWPVFLLIPAFAQTVTARTFINASFSAILIISHTQWAPALIDRYVQGFPERRFGYDRFEDVAKGKRGAMEMYNV